MSRSPRVGEDFRDDRAPAFCALDARRARPDIRVVLRLFDDDLVAKVRDSFKAEALSSSALAAPAMALSALDPRIIHSFRMGEHLMVVSDFEAGAKLATLTLEDLRVKFGAFTLGLRAFTGESIPPPYLIRNAG